MTTGRFKRTHLVCTRLFRLTALVRLATRVHVASVYLRRDAQPGGLCQLQRLCLLPLMKLMARLLTHFELLSVELPLPPQHSQLCRLRVGRGRRFGQLAAQRLDLYALLVERGLAQCQVGRVHPTQTPPFAGISTNRLTAEPTPATFTDPLPNFRVVVSACRPLEVPPLRVRFLESLGLATHSAALPGAAMADWYRSSLGEFEAAAFLAPPASLSGDGRTTPEWLRDAEQHLRDKPKERTSNDAPVEADALPLETVRGAVRRLMLSAGEVIDGSSDEAFELLVAIEHILGHGFKRRSTLLAALSPDRTLWSFISESLEKFCEPARKTTAFVRSANLSDAERSGVWLRLCLNEGCVHQTISSRPPHSPPCTRRGPRP